jgi:hypothetical protein
MSLSEKLLLNTTYQNLLFLKLIINANTCGANQVDSEIKRRVELLSDCSETFRRHLARSCFRYDADMCRNAKLLLPDFDLDPAGWREIVLGSDL